MILLLDVHWISTLNHCHFQLVWIILYDTTLFIHSESITLYSFDNSGATLQVPTEDNYIVFCHCHCFVFYCVIGDSILLWKLRKIKITLQYFIVRGMPPVIAGHSFYFWYCTLKYCVQAILLHALYYHYRFFC